jgi:ubiquilin
MKRGGVYYKHDDSIDNASTTQQQSKKTVSFLYSLNYYHYYYYIMTVPSITLHVRMSSGARLSVELNDSLEATTVLQVKEKISLQQTDCPPERQRLIYKGRVLDEERTLSDYGVLPGSTLHLVKSRAPDAPAPAPVSASTTTQPTRNPFSPPAAAAATPAAQPTNNPFGGMPMPPGGMPSPEQMSQMMNNPMVQSMLDNPEFLRNMMESNPQIQAMLDSNPQ